MSINQEHRTSIRMSVTALETLQEDAKVFLNLDLDKKHIGPYINRVLENFMDSSRASAHLEIQKLEKELQDDVLEARKNKSAKAKTGRRILGLSDQEKQEIHDIASLRVRRSCGELAADKNTDHVVLYLNNNILGMLYPDHNAPDYWSEQGWYKRPGTYLRAVLEDYAMRSTYEREQICFRETMDKIRVQLDRSESARKTLIITYQESAGLGQGKKEVFEVIPYRFSREDETDYNYLIGISHRLNDPEHPHPDFLALFRIYGIADIRQSGNKADPISTGTRQKIEEKAKNLGISFMLGDSADCRILLTQSGVTMYNRYQHNRPKAVKVEAQEDGSAIYTFRSTYYHMEQYFHSFGKNAIVLSPEGLVEKFRNFYSEALANYRDTSDPSH